MRQPVGGFGVAQPALSYSLPRPGAHAARRSSLLLPRAPRFDVYMEAELVTDRCHVQGMIRNISDGGAMFICSGEPGIANGTSCLVDIPLNDSAPRHAAREVWSRPRPDPLYNFAVGLQWRDPERGLAAALLPRWQRWSSIAVLPREFGGVNAMVTGKRDGHFWAHRAVVTGGSLSGVSVRFPKAVPESIRGAATLSVGHRSAAVECVSVMDAGQVARLMFTAWGAQFVIEQLERGRSL